VASAPKNANDPSGLDYYTVHFLIGHSQWVLDQVREKIAEHPVRGDLFQRERIQLMYDYSVRTNETPSRPTMFVGIGCSADKGAVDINSSITALTGKDGSPFYTS